MEHYQIILTKEDQRILDSFTPIAEGLGAYLGENCEIIIHNLEHLDASVMTIVHGHHSGRKVGAPISDFTLSLLHRMLEDTSLRHISYFAKNKRGETFKAFTAAILGENERIIGLFCINLYLSASVLSLMQNFYPQAQNDTEHVSEIFVENTEELMLSSLENAKKEVYGNPAISSSNKNKEIIYLLAQKGIFNLKDAVIFIAEHMGISKNTVYMHLRNKNK